MARYVVGDVQGCMRSFERLLARVEFDAGRDAMLFVGDLVNRGPRSLEVLRWARAHDAVCVLGNHEIHLLGVRKGWREPEDGDASAALAAAADGEELLDWIRGWPLVHRMDAWFLVHAGLLPSWSFDEVERRARVVETLLARDDDDFLQALGRPTDALRERFRVELETTAVLTRIRGVDRTGAMCAAPSGGPEVFPPEIRPWYEPDTARRSNPTVLFGHWASLGVRHLPGAISLDSGCVWGGWLSCLRLDDGQTFQVDADPSEVYEWRARPDPCQDPTSLGRVEED